MCKKKKRLVLKVKLPFELTDIKYRVVNLLEFKHRFLVYFSEDDIK